MTTQNISYVLYGERDLRAEDCPVSALRPDEVLVKIKRMGICGSDIHYFQHGRVGTFIPRRPFILGHEAAGEIVEVGAEVTGLEAGVRVAIDPAQPCNVCKYCKQGRYNLCMKMKYFGSASTDPHVDGVFREYAVIPERCCYILPKDVDYSVAALLEPLSVAIHSIKRAGSIYGASVLVMGGGAIGQLILFAARQFGAGHLVVSDVDEGRRRFALDHFADETIDPTDDESFRKSKAATDGFDIIFEASGAEVALVNALEIAPRGATIIQVGSLPTSLSLPANLIMSKELNVLGSFRFANVFSIALNLAQTHGAELELLITHTLPFANFLDAMAIACARGQALKVQVASE